MDTAKELAKVARDERAYFRSGRNLGGHGLCSWPGLAIGFRRGRYAHRRLAAAPPHGHERRVVIVLSHVQHAFSIRLADLGVSWRRLFYLWKEAGILGADARWGVDDRCVVFRRICRFDVANVHRVDGSYLHASEARLLTAKEAIPAGRVAFEG